MVSFSNVEDYMTYLPAIMLVALTVSLLGRHSEADAEAIQPLTPQAAQEYASDAEKADGGDPEAAYRMGEALASGRLGGLKDLHKALGYYRSAAEKGHHQAADRVIQIEAELARAPGKEEPKSPPPSQ
jgi:TPR repeat protein